MAFLNDDGRRALIAAVETVEAESAAEIVVALRPRADLYLGAALVSSWVFALGTLAFLLYSPFVFGLHRFLIDVGLAGLVGGLLLAVPGAMRLVVPDAIMADRVARAAKATFVDKGVGLTTGRTGVLVFVALAERRVAVIADAGVRDVVDDETWSKATARLDHVVHRGGDATALAAAIADLAGLLGDALPRLSDDVNELPDAPDEVAA